MIKIGRSHDAWAREDTVRHLYVHIPFCARICPYCAFYKSLLDRSQTDRFCDALLGEVDRYLEEYRIVPFTIYFGGGTPTALTTAQLEKLVAGLRARLDLSSLQEWTVEANPGSVSEGKAQILRGGGVTRISLGVQSWDEGLLQMLGREHNAAQAAASFQLLRTAGFANINVDLMFGLPNQTPAQWSGTLERTVELAPDHISAYSLTFEEDTEFFRAYLRGEMGPDEGKDAEFFDRTIAKLEAAGYAQYEISNYARPGFESVHNRAYWAGQDYLGIGPSAFSTMQMQRWQNVCDYRGYADRILRGESAVASTECLTGAKKRTERIALSLRTRTGISLDLLDNRESEVREFVALGLVEMIGNNLVLTPAGRKLTDSVAEALL